MEEMVPVFRLVNADAGWHQIYEYMGNDVNLFHTIPKRQ